MGSFTDAIGATVKKARKTVDSYAQAAKDLASLPGKVKDTVALTDTTAAYTDAEKAAAARKRSRR